jgi:hypothetical protein
MARLGGALMGARQAGAGAGSSGATGKRRWAARCPGIRRGWLASRRHHQGDGSPSADASQDDQLLGRMAYHSTAEAVTRGLLRARTHFEENVLITTGSTGLDHLVDGGVCRADGLQIPDRRRYQGRHVQALSRPMLDMRVGSIDQQSRRVEFGNGSNAWNVVT